MQYPTDSDNCDFKVGWCFHKNISRNPPSTLPRINLTQESPPASDKEQELSRFILSFQGDEGLEDSINLAYAVWYALWDIFGSAASQTHSMVLVSFRLGVPHHRLQEILQELLLREDSGSVKISRAWWYQRYPIFSYPNLTQKLEEARGRPYSSQSGSITNASSLSSLPARVAQHELPPPPETLYERYVDHLQSYICLSIFGDSEADVNKLHEWLNDPRVDEFWKDSGSLEFHVKWLKERYDDTHVLPILGSYRGARGGDKASMESFGYFEIYWATEDKISKVYPVDTYDRGIHMLVGSSAHRGPHRVRSWLPSLVHYIFSVEPRTQRVVSEPDSRNLKMIRYLENVGFTKVKEADMGHKIAAIMVLERDQFWKACPL